MQNYFQSLTIDYATFITLNLLLSSLVILFERKNPTAALAWLFFLNLIPGIGFIFYILLAQNISKRRVFKYTQEEATLYSNLLKEQRQSIKSDTFEYKKNSTAKYKDMILFHNNLSGSIFSQNNDIKIYTNGLDKFNDLFSDIEQATHHIHLLYFIVKHDDLSIRLCNLLIKKVSQGVEVRFLVDHVGGRQMTRSQIKELKNAGVQVAFFFPSKLKYINIKGNYRNHRKIAVIDGSIGYVGGLNIGDEYLGLDKKFGFWRDTHLRIMGNAVVSLQIRFILDWRNASGKQLEISTAYLKNPDITTNASTAVQIVHSGPDSINQQIKQGYLQMIHDARDYIYIQSPYFIPDESITEALKIAAASGVDVRIMIPNKPDHPFVYWATYSYCGELIPYGIRIFTYENGFLHAKTIVCDDQVSAVGTCNFDIRSFKLNFEVSAFIYDIDHSKELKHYFIKDITQSFELTQSKYENRPFYIKIKEAISRLFSPIL